MSTAVQIITGHNFMKRHQSIVDANPDDAECCLRMEDEESSLHVFAQCPAIAAQRQQVFGLSFQTEPLQWSLPEIVRFITEASVDSLLDPVSAE